MIKKILFYILLALFINACGTNTHHFSPEKYDEIIKPKEEKYSIKRTNINYAQLSHHSPIKFLNKDKRIIQIDDYKGYMLLAKNDNLAVLSSKNGDLVVLANDDDENSLTYTKNSSRQIYQNTFKEEIILAAVKDGYLAAISANNTLYAIDLQTQKILLLEEQSSSIGQIPKLANPIFANNLIIYPTLDAKLVFFDMQTNQIVKDIPIGSRDFFNNILALDVINSNFIAISTTKVLSIYQNNLKSMDLNLVDAVVYDGYIYAIKDNGEIVKLNPQLQEIASHKFEFAKINSISIINDKIYLLESEGYIIQMDSSLQDIKIFKIDEYNSSKTYPTNKGFYFDRYFIELK